MRGDPPVEVLGAGVVRLTPTTRAPTDVAAAANEAQASSDAASVSGIERLLITEAIGAGLFIVAAGGFAALAPWIRHASLLTFVVLGFAYMVALQVRFPVGHVWTAPTELVLVPMLFALPLPAIPLLVSGCALISGLLHRSLPGARSVAGLVAVFGDSFYVLGPAVVLALAGSPSPGWHNWPVMLAAFAAQALCDSASGLARSWFADGAPPAAETQMLWSYACDTCLACVGLVIASATSSRAGAGLFALCVFPLLGLLEIAARDRQELMRSRIHLTQAQTVAGMGSAESDLTGKHVLWSGEVSRLHNLPAETSPSVEALLQGLSADDAMQLEACHADCMRTGTPVELEYTVLANGLGPERIVRMHLCRHQDSTKGMFATYQDVTDRVRRGRAEAASRAKSEFLSRMSHELRTPLNAILGFGRLLQHDSLTDAQRENARRIVDAGQHLLKQIDEILDISRVEAGKLTVSPVPVAVQDLLSEVLPTAEVLTQRHGLRLTVDAGAGDAYVIADPVRMRQALTNLLSNAVKYNRPGGEVQLRLDDQDPERVRISISDQGPGIADVLIPRLFVAFDRLGAEHSGVEGTGLGLVVTKAIVEAAKGVLEVDTAAGAGSTFTIDLPRLPAPVQSPLADAPPSSAPAYASSISVLLVEDNAANVALVQSIFDAIPNLRLLTAYDGATGLARATEHRPDVILLDLILPDIAGELVLQRLTEAPRTSMIPVIAVTADVGAERRQRALSAGASAYLPKPFDPSELIGTLETVARQAQQDRDPQPYRDPVPLGLASGGTRE